MTRDKTCLLVQPIHEVGRALLRDNGIEPVLCPSPDMTTVAGMIRDVDAVITRNAGLSASAFAAAERLRVVVVHGTGHNAVDKAAARARGVMVCNTPGVNAQSVAELALGLILAAARSLVAADAAARAGDARFRDAGRFTELAGKTALIVGWGGIGARLGRMLAAGFGMEVLVHSPNAPEVAGFERVGLEHGLARADLVSLHTPMREETRGLINAARLGAMKPGAILVNTAREGLVEEAALAAALHAGHLGAAGLDVYEEPLSEALRGAPRLVLTPHVGASTEDALRAVALGAAGHVVTALAGGVPATRINKS